MRDDLAAAAMTIQAGVRGYNVRKSRPLTHLRKIDTVRRALRELQGKAADPAYIEWICVDVTECRKLTEGIMALVLQLDALQDIHPDVRDIRKTVNREVVQFMEVIDAVVVGAPTSPWQDTKNNPNMGRSNSMSHMDFVGNQSLKRMHSLDNCTYPQQGYKKKHDSRLEYREGDIDLISLYGRASHSLRGSPPNVVIDSVVGNSGQEGMIDHSGLEVLRTMTAVVVIQASFRGYRVRRSRPLKHMRTIADVRAKLRELTVQVSIPNFHSKLRSDEMSRLRVSECITALLLQLDSVQGVNQVIRDIRKSITAEVFKLQELVDVLISNPDIVEVGLTSPLNAAEIKVDDASRGRSRDSQCCSSDKWMPEGEDSTGADVPLHSLSLYNTGLENLDDDIRPPTPEYDRQRNPMYRDESSSNSSAEQNSQGRGLDHVQVRVPDRFTQSITTTSSSNETVEGNGSSDHGPGPCAAVVSGKEYSSHVDDEHAGTVPALKPEGLSQEMPEDFQARKNPDNDESIVGREKLGGDGRMDSAGQLEQENTKLKALLHQVLMFAEIQYSVVSKVMETNEKLKVENARYKTREKRTKSARRRW